MGGCGEMHRYIKKVICNKIKVLGQMKSNLISTPLSIGQVTLLFHSVFVLPHLEEDDHALSSNRLYDKSKLVLLLDEFITQISMRLNLSHIA